MIDPYSKGLKVRFSCNYNSQALAKNPYPKGTSDSQQFILGVFDADEHLQNEYDKEQELRRGQIY